MTGCPVGEGRGEKRISIASIGMEDNDDDNSSADERRQKVLQEEELQVKRKVVLWYWKCCPKMYCSYVSWTR